jgi:hypothetical protein
MALDKATLKTAIENALNAAKGSADPNATFAQSLADAIDIFVKTGNATGTDVPGGNTHNLSIS